MSLAIVVAREPTAAHVAEVRLVVVRRQDYAVVVVSMRMRVLMGVGMDVGVV